MAHKYKLNYFSEFLGFLSGVAEDSVRVGYDAVSLGKRIPMFRRNVLPSSLTFKGHRRSQKNHQGLTDPLRRDMITHWQGIVFQKNVTIYHFCAKIVTKVTMLSLFHAMKAYRGSRDMDPLILNLGPRWRWVVKSTLHPRPRTPVPIAQKAWWAPQLLWTFRRR